MNARGMENSVTLLEFQMTLVGQMEIAFALIRLKQNLQYVYTYIYL